jgi:hypothetical protein
MLKLPWYDRSKLHGFCRKERCILKSRIWHKSLHDFCDDRMAFRMSLYHATQTKGRVHSWRVAQKMNTQWSHTFIYYGGGMTYWVKNHHMKKYGCIYCKCEGTILFIYIYFSFQQEFKLLFKCKEREKFHPMWKEIPNCCKPCVCIGGAWKGIFKRSSNIDTKHVEYLYIFETLCHDHHVHTSFNFEDLWHM